MSGYRSLKRVLGESNLERKCRWLFGLCVGGLIVLAFWTVGYITEDLIDRSAKDKGRDLVRVHLIEVHWRKWGIAPGEKPLQEEMIASLAQEEYLATMLKLTPSPESILSSSGPASQLPGNETERNLLQQLKARSQEQTQAREAKAAAAPEMGEATVESEAPLTVEAFVDPSQDQYYYYQVVQWQESCTRCHLGMHGAFSQPAASTAGIGLDDLSTPFRVVRVVMPYAEMRSAINRTRAVLSAVGLLTVFLAMVLLYFVVKYIVIKPMTHLREVSDAVARGDFDQRAEIHTNDEFEVLADSFNKMLRNMVEAHSELRETNTELDAKVDELARLNMQLHDMNRLKGEFLANMSHELRTPLNSIIGFSEVLQGIDALNERQKRFVLNIKTSGQKLLELINDILDLAKMEAGRMEVRLSEFRIDAVIHTQCELVRSLAEDKNIDIGCEGETDLPHLYQDKAKVEQILTNLLSNAIKFTPEGGRITVGARGDGRGRIEFWVSDTGVGIPESEQEIIFERFRQGKSARGDDNLTREYSGTGLGLSIVRELCKLLGGEVSVESELGKGSTFRVVLPWIRTDQPLTANRISNKLDDLSRARRLEIATGTQPAEVGSGGQR